VRGDSLGESLRKPHLGPLPPGPVSALGKAFVQRGERKIQQRNKCKPILKRVIKKMRRRIVAGKDFVERKNGPEFKVRVGAKLTYDLLRVPVVLLKQELEPVKHGFKRRLAAREVRFHELFEDARVAVRGIPVLGYLLEPAGRALALRLAVTGNEFLLQSGNGCPHPWQRLRRSRLLAFGGAHNGVHLSSCTVGMKDE